MSSETPADRPSTSSDQSDQVQPRRALGPGDQQSDHDHPDGHSRGDHHDDGPNDPAQSPATPVRFGERVASRRRGGKSESGDGWGWDLPPAADEPAVSEVARPLGSPQHDADDPRPAQTDSTVQPEAEPAAGSDAADDEALSAGQPKARAAAESGTEAKAPPGKKAATDRPALPGKQRFKLLQGVGPRAAREDIPDQSHLPADERTDLAVRVTDLSITYRTSFEKKPTLRQAILRLGRGQRAVREIKALQHLTFEVKTGSSIGIIGRNGAGKSTLMRAMAGILPPTSGTVEVWGRASTLLALGVGFNNALSGRENIILGGLAAGLALDEVEQRAKEIADWTELGDFIDMPMRTYSSGMASRVAFAVAVHMEPDILMIDEGLSTGDAHFKDKASAKMAELRDKARAMFLVSHGLGSIKELCDEAIWIDRGRMMERGEPEYVIERYLSHLKSKPRATAMEDL